MDGEKQTRDELIGLVRALRAGVEFEGENFAHGVLPLTGDDPGARAGCAPAAPVLAAPPPPREKPAKKGSGAPAGGVTLSLFGDDDRAVAPGARAGATAKGKEHGKVVDLPQWSDQKLKTDEAAATLKMLQDEIGPRCTRCQLAKLGRSQVVFGVGKPNADLVFVGEGPGEDEDRQGEPFVGRAGQLLTKMIVAMGLERRDVYICNVVKCHPPGNRDPEPEEQRVCGKFLERQLDVIRPRIIVALGKIAAMYLKGITDIPKEKFPISKYRGRFERYQGADMMLTYHPSYLLRAPSAKKEVWADLKAVMQVLGLKGSEK
ncbi:MAG: uracil-DNA glycosylase [Deltaproteobacteria bacterium]|nr:uracil-DNA glycosylase [Deltaproteobacteria bacterium]